MECSGERSIEINKFIEILHLYTVALLILVGAVVSRIHTVVFQFLRLFCLVEEFCGMKQRKHLIRYTESP